MSAAFAISNHRCTPVAANNSVPEGRNTPLSSAVIIKLSAARRGGHHSQTDAAYTAAHFSLSAVSQTASLTARAAALRAATRPAQPLKTPDGLGRVTTAKGGIKAVDRQYTYDARAKITAVRDYAVTGNNRNYAYDGLGQLVSATGPWGAGSFKYDSLGNLRQKTLGSRRVDLTYDSRNRLTRSADTGAPAGQGTGTRTIAYDTRGNVTTLGSMGFVYDHSDQPVTVSGSANNVNGATGATRGNYRYDGNLKRVKSVVNGKTIYNVYNAAGRLVHVDNVATAKQEDYLYAGGMMIGRRDQNGAIAITHTDHLGGTVSQTDGAGNVQWRQRYSPFGGELDNTAGTDDRAGFTGHIKDSATGLNYMQARYYDPVIGRFLSVDPVDFITSGQNPAYFNRYAYAGNDPINNIDPDGRCFGPIAFACAGALLSGGGTATVSTATVVTGAAIVGCTVGCDDIVEAATGTSDGTILGDNVVSHIFEDRSGGNVFESRSHPPEPLPEAGDRPHSIPQPDGGYTTHEETKGGRSIEGKQYRPDAKQPDGSRAPNVKEWTGNTSPDGTRHQGKPEKRPPQPEEVREPN